MTIQSSGNRSVIGVQNAAEPAAPGTSTMKGIALHVVDALGLVHALILRLQALVLPFKVLVFSGGH